MDSKQLAEVIGSRLVGAGFSRSGQTWFRESTETIALANLQKSRYGPCYYMNLGFWIKSLGDPPSIPPREHLCHIRARADSELEPGLGRTLDLEVPIDDGDRRSELHRIVTETVIPFLVQGESLAGLRVLVEGRLEHVTSVTARRVLGVGDTA